MELIFASHNPYKLAEVRAGLLGHKVQSLESIGWSDEIPEAADSLVGNALIKARTVYSKLGRDCLADDTGLEVDALGGKPGVLTARFAGEKATATENRAKVLQMMKDHRQRTAKFRTVIVLILDGKEFLFEGCMQGTLATHERGEVKFGYDSLFIPQGFVQTYGEMSFSLRSQIGHRGKALKKLAAELDLQTKKLSEIHL